VGTIARRFISASWSNFNEKALNQWYRFNLSWLQKFKGPVHLIFYEDLKTDLREEIITQFLGVTPTFVECALPNAQGNFLRNATKKPDLSDLYDEAVICRTDECIRKVHQVAFSANHVTMSATGHSHASNISPRG